jgi:hypothetical protein
VKDVVAPDGERGFLEPAFAGAAAAIVEAKEGAAFALRPGFQGERLGAFHVGHVAGEEDDGRASAKAVIVGESEAVGPGEIIGHFRKITS